MKSLIIFLLLSVSLFMFSAAMADCSVELSYKELVDCITSSDTEPDVTDLMSSEAAKNTVATTDLSEATEDLNTISALTEEPPR